MEDPRCRRPQTSPSVFCWPPFHICKEENNILKKKWNVSFTQGHCLCQVRFVGSVVLASSQVKACADPEGVEGGSQPPLEFSKT